MDLPMKMHRFAVGPLAILTFILVWSLLVDGPSVWAKMVPKLLRGWIVLSLLYVLVQYLVETFRFAGDQEEDDDVILYFYILVWFFNLTI